MCQTATAALVMGLLPLIHAAPNANNPCCAWSGFHVTIDATPSASESRNAYLDDVEGVCRFLLRYQAPAQAQNAGAVLDPILGREHQYTTPYLASAVGALLHAGRAQDLLDAGVMAMDWATRCVAERRIPDKHGEFFIAPLAEALARYAGRVPSEKIETWRARLQLPIDQIIEGMNTNTNNWRTYAMKGEWTRYRAGLVEHDNAVAFVEDGWLRRTQRDRIVPDPLRLYQDRSSDPQSMAVEAVGRGNLLALAANGYDGSSGAAIRDAAFAGTHSSLFFQDPTGQCPPNGRTDDHVFNDVLYTTCFETMARACREDDPQLAGRYRRAATLAHRSIQRWKRTDGAWAGSFYVTKNHLDPEARVGYQPASQYSNYNATIALHLAEAAEAVCDDVTPRPAPCEIGGYVLRAGPVFDCFAANAGGLHVFGNLRGDSVPKYGIFWTTLGVVRIARSGWDSRLGPSDGAFDGRSKSGVSIGPAWKTSRAWTRLADHAKDYRGQLEVDFVHPLLVRFSVRYAPVSGKDGPAFRQTFTVTPTGILTRLSCGSGTRFGLSIPALENDGRPLTVDANGRCLTTKYSDGGDQQCFIVPDGRIEEDGEPVLSTYGYLRPYRVTSSGDEVALFICPRKEGEPEAAEILHSLKVTETGFSSAVGKVEGDVFYAKGLVGGQAGRVTLETGAELRFSDVCQFILRSAEGTPTTIEADRPVTLTTAEGTHRLEPYTPKAF